MTKEYANYEDIDQAVLQKDIDDIKKRLGNPTWEDFQHLKKLELWGRISFLLGFLLLVGLAYFSTTDSIGTLTTSLLVLLSATLIGVANVSRWANVAHPILHGAYDKVPNIPYRYTKAGFAKGWRRYTDLITTPP